jgi:Cu2+-exporting ATPase
MMAAEAFVAPACCLHCGLDIPPGPRLFATLQGEQVPVCCVGCRAVAEMLENSGLGDWYARREGPSGRAASLPNEVLERIVHLETQALEDAFVDSVDSGRSKVELLVDDLRCAACVWVIEEHLGSLSGVDSVRVRLASRRVEVVWDADRLRLRQLIERLAEIGFAARPDRPGAEAERDRRENRAALIRLGIAGLGAMNVMTYAVALYAGGFEGMSRGAEALMRWMGWLVSTPVVLISARPFFAGAWRDLARRRPGMDVPVALAIGGAYAVSAVATARGTGEVYFDSVCMFTFFLSLGRYLEQRTQSRGASLVREMTDATPVLARRLDRVDGEDEVSETVVSARALVAGDRLRVLAGEAVPADGVVIEGASAVDEALLSGEPWPRTVSMGDFVVAGSQNIDQTLVLEAQKVGQDTKLAAILSLVDRASSDRAPIAAMADRVAAYFVTTVLGIALVNWIAWNALAPERAVWTTLSVLVATCPCALSLATPLAIASASQGLARVGFLITNASALEALARIDRFLFDKTGTLTKGTPSIQRIVTCSERTQRDVFELARTLERESTHPIARAFADGTDEWIASSDRDFDKPWPGPSPVVRDRRSAPGAGVEGWVGGRRYRLGRADWSVGDAEVPAIPTAGSGEQWMWVLLSDDEGALAWFGLADSLRDHVDETLASLRSAGFALEMLSGDPSPSAAGLAERLELDMQCLAASPTEKFGRVRFLQDSGERVALVGDGVNDSPSLRAADVSIAMGSGCDLSRLNADAVLLKDDLTLLPIAHVWARRTKRIITQNLGWAVVYNSMALPLAVTGVLSPWMAALGMSLSSLVVVLNANRLTMPERPRLEGRPA